MLIILVQFCSFVDSLQVGHLVWFVFRYPESREYDAAVVAKYPFLKGKDGNGHVCVLCIKISARLKYCIAFCLVVQ